MTEDLMSPAIPYVIQGITFRQWIVDRSALPGTSRYEWRGESLGRTLIVGKHPGCRVSYRADGSKDIHLDYWVSVAGKPVRGVFETLKMAMRAAVNASERRAAA